MRNSLLIGRGGRILDVVDWMTAINLTYFRDSGKAVFVLDFHDDVKVRSVHKEFELPSVMLLIGNRDRYPDSQHLNLSRKNVFLRDESTCQWCGRKLNNTNGTIDHVFPTCRGGTNTWRNVVACCVDCNNQKGKMTGDEFTKRTGKKLRKRPIVPHRAVLFRSYIDKEGYEKWTPYLEKFVEKAAV